MKSYPPYKIFLTFLLIAFLIVFIFLIIPGDRYELRDILFGDDSRRSGSDSRPPELSGMLQHPVEEPVHGDTRYQDKEILFPDFINQVLLEYPDENDSILLPFIKSFRDAKNGRGSCRIVHIGDSQLEEDRISKYIRAALLRDIAGASKSNFRLDNLALRGSAGLEFTKGTADSLLTSGDLGLPDLIIMQFGINVVPADRNDFDYYAEYLKVQIKYINDLVPGTPLLIVGASDMGRLQNGVPEAYLSVEKVSGAQRRAAMESGSAFYDLLSFMGGPGSFMKWVDSDPPLMRRDYTHFSFRGGELVGEGIAGALKGEFNNFIESE